MSKRDNVKATIVVGLLLFVGLLTTATVATALALILAL